MTDAQQAKQQAEQTVSKAGDHPVVEWGARLGYAANGIVHLLLGWLAIQLALGSSSESADQSGAFGMLADNTLGKVLLIVAVVGFALLAIWQLTEAIRGPELTDRLKAGGKFIAYLAVGWSALGFVRASGSSSGDQTKDFTQKLMEAPGGVVLVVVVGLGVLGIGGYHIYKGWKRKFREDLRENPGEGIEKLAMFGYIAKGVALMVVGGLFIAAALDHDPEKARGLDGALKALLSAPGGQILLIVVGLGLAAYGLYAFARAKYAKV
ncbi:DUF1206 domain-containing protein [Aestuariimicrobium ganziense]|uniref:DUF1206 domain-containing protein n=1 Tax=Aestuariimicrobium ganziense TaxID=2773677 RepID=UPI0019427A74|nr:DUF1206 domain-containing protein [Aestuariimicrobium ganziense]